MTADDKPRRRRLSEDERALWRGVTRSIAPLKRRQGLAELLAETATAERRPRPKSSTSKSSTSKSSTPKRTDASSRPALHARPALASAPPLLPLDRRLKRKLARGTEEIAARIDLHGRTQSQAHAALLRFVANAQADGIRIGLVITGKGSGQDNPAGERGVLQRMVPLWLTLPEFRAFVVGVEEAHLGHGGRGALYVLIRQRRGRV